MFEKIIGQDLAKKLLEGSIMANRLPSAFLFYGPEGVGKRTFALHVAKAANCSKVEHGYCEECFDCKAVNNLTHPDLRLVFPVRNAGSLEGLPTPELYDKQGTITINMVRILRKEASLKPFQKGKRIFVVLNADRMNQEASNAFLKLLEEPPADTLVILTTERPNFLFATVRSRCQMVMFSRLRADDIEDALVEKMGAERNRAHLVAALSGGSLGWAEKMLKDYADEHRLKMFDFILESSPQDDLAVLDFSREMVDESLVYETLDVLQSMCKDLLATKMGTQKTLINIDQHKLLEKGAARMTCEEIYDIIYGIEDAFSDLNKNVNSRLVLFNLLSRVHEKSLTRA